MTGSVSGVMLADPQPTRFKEKGGPKMIKNAVVPLISVLLLGSSAVVVGEVAVVQSEDASPLADGDIEEQIRELLERVREDPSEFLRWLPLVLIGVFWLIKALTSTGAGGTEVTGARKESSDPDSESSRSFNEAPAQEFQKSRQTRRLERTITDEGGTRGFPLG